MLPESFEKHLTPKVRERLLTVLNSPEGREVMAQVLDEVGGWPSDGLSARLVAAKVLRDGPKVRVSIAPQSVSRAVSSGPMLIDGEPDLKGFTGPLQLLSDRVSVAFDAARAATIRGIEQRALGMLYEAPGDRSVVEGAFNLLKGAWRRAFSDVAEVPIQQAAEMGSRQLMVASGWTVTEAMERAEPWAKVHAERVADNAFDLNLDALFTLMRDLDDTGESRRRSQRLVQAAWGVDRRTAKSIVARRRGNPDMRFSVLMRGIRKIADANRVSRADLTGDTETMSAFNMGRVFVIDEAIRDGLVPPSVKKVWVTAEDERTCQICRPMDGVKVGMREYFPVGEGSLMFPPAHPRCRCIIVPKVK